MSSNTHLRSGKDYQSCFDSKWYITENYSEAATGTDFNKFVVNSLHKIYSTGQITGKHLVDIGSGPCIHMVIPAAKWFEEITLSDYSPANREMQQKWLNKDKDAHDWTAFLSTSTNLITKKNSSELEDEVRKKIHKVVQCDVHSLNPLYPESFERIDVISTSLCLESASSDVKEYTQAMKNVVSLLNKDGKFILMGVLNNPFYTVGSEKFNCLSLQMSDVIGAVQNSGLRVLETLEDTSQADGDVAPYNGAFLILAEKI